MDRRHCRACPRQHRCRRRPGAVTGAVAGGLVGNNVEKTQQANAAAQAQAQNQMAIGEVIQLVQSHVSDDVIITKIRTSGSIFSSPPPTFRTSRPTAPATMSSTR